MYAPKRSIATMRGVRAKLRDSLDAVCYRTISCRTEQFDFGLMRLLTLSFQCRLRCPETTKARCGMKPSPSLAAAVPGMIDPNVLYRGDYGAGAARMEGTCLADCYTQRTADFALRWQGLCPWIGSDRAHSTAGC